jgi:hypothetical protein
VKATDLLRAATVLLHASLEDLLRSIAVFRIPESGEEILNKVPLMRAPPIGRPEKFLLGALRPYKHKKVDELIQDSVRAYYRSFVTFNNTSEIATLLESCQIDLTGVRKFFPILDEMIQRRHEIVHHADREHRHRIIRALDDPGNRGHHVAKSLSLKKVERWVRSTERFATKILDLMSNGEYSKQLRSSQQQL